MRDRTLVVLLCFLLTQFVGCSKKTPPHVAAKANAEVTAPDAATDAALAQPPVTTADTRLFAYYDALKRRDCGSAEAELRQLILEFPNDPRGYRSLAQFLNAQGRRTETRKLLLDVERLDGMSKLEALSLVDLGGPFMLVDFGELTKSKSPSLYTLSDARFMYGKGERHQETLEVLGTLRGTEFETLAARAFVGRVIAESNDDEMLNAWVADLPSGIDVYPEYWLAIGMWLERHERWQEAVRAYGEALRRDPTERRALRSLADVLDQIGGEVTSAKTRETVTTLDRIVRLASAASAKDSRWIGEQLTQLVRPLEAIAWFRDSLVQSGASPSSMAELEARRDEIVRWANSATEEKVTQARLIQMVGFDIKTYPLPRMDTMAESALHVATEEDSTNYQIKFADTANELGIATQFVSDYPAIGRGFLLYQANGGGIAVIDYDLDGHVDLYFAQSGGDPRAQDGSTPNELYRSLAAERFVEVSEPSLTNDRGYGQGVCAADVNQDGFDDLVVANFGRNSLYLNQGDGSFRAAHDLIASSSATWTTSIAVADLDGDHLPDMVEVNYVDDPEVFNSPCGPRHTDCAPHKFATSQDRFMMNDGSGRFVNWSPSSLPGPPASYGMGIVVANFDGLYGNDVFITNDGDLNHYWKSWSGETTTGKASFELRECGAISGCAIGGNGYSQACMGIASGDLDGNGSLDLFVTNFHDEPANLYLQNASANFSDQARSVGLAEKTMATLGFGAQAADFDNDGRNDIANLNGHLYDASASGIPFKMLPQLFRGRNKTFESIEPESLGEYWCQTQLGRTLVQTDYDRDGRVDLIANSLTDPVAVLHNQSDAGNWIEFELVGVTSERAAIGAKITLVAGDVVKSAWQIAGDGYMASNDPVVHVGLDSVNSFDEVIIHWPSGAMTKVANVDANRRYQVIENEPSLFLSLP